MTLIDVKSSVWRYNLSDFTGNIMIAYLLVILFFWSIQLAQINQLLLPQGQLRIWSSGATRILGEEASGSSRLFIDHFHPYEDKVRSF